MPAKRITCITNRGDHHYPHQRIQTVGGIGWSRTVDEVIRDIETGSSSYYVQIGVRSIRVVVAHRNGHKYIKTVDDEYVPHNLLALPRC